MSGVYMYVHCYIDTTSIGQFQPNLDCCTCFTLSYMYFKSKPLIVCVPVNQEVVYSSAIYRPFAFSHHQFQTTLEGVWSITQKGFVPKISAKKPFLFYVSNLTKKTFMYALCNSKTGHISVTSWSLVRRPIK